MQLFVFDTFDTGIQIQNSTDFKKNTSPYMVLCLFRIELWIVHGKPIIFYRLDFLHIVSELNFWRCTKILDYRSIAGLYNLAKV